MYYTNKPCVLFVKGVYWTGNGWSTDRKDAREYPTFEAAENATLGLAPEDIEIHYA